MENKQNKLKQTICEVSDLSHGSLTAEKEKEIAKPLRHHPLIAKLSKTRRRDSRGAIYRVEFAWKDGGLNFIC